MTWIKKDREVVAYCRGPYCLMSLDAVELLRARGLRASRLDAGVLEWPGRDLPRGTLPGGTP